MMYLYSYYVLGCELDGAKKQGSVVVMIVVEI